MVFVVNIAPFRIFRLIHIKMRWICSKQTNKKESNSGRLWEGEILRLNRFSSHDSVKCEWMKKFLFLFPNELEIPWQVTNWFDLWFNHSYKIHNSFESCKRCLFFQSRTFYAFKTGDFYAANRANDCRKTREVWMFIGIHDIHKTDFMTPNPKAQEFRL